MPKYNSPKELYGEAVMEEMITGNMDPENLDADMMPRMLMITMMTMMTMMTSDDHRQRGS